jgi:hypothetical protein
MAKNVLYPRNAKMWKNVILKARSTTRDVLLVLEHVKIPILFALKFASLAVPAVREEL